MDGYEKCFNCEHLKYRGADYRYPYKCRKRPGVSCESSEIREHFKTPCQYYEEKKKKENEE